MIKEDKKLKAVEVIRAATNSPELSTIKVKLGEKEYTVVDLPYDDYIEFLAHLQPLIEGLLSKLAQAKGIEFNAESLTTSGLLKYCSKALPEMARLCLKQTVPTITSEEIKIAGKTPFALAVVVLKQIEQNKIISEISSFFVQMAPLLRAGLNQNL